MLVLGADSAISLQVPGVGLLRMKPAKPSDMKNGPATLMSLQLDREGTTERIEIGWKPDGSKTGKFLIDCPDDVLVVRDNVGERRAA